MRIYGVHPASASVHPRIKPICRESPAGVHAEQLRLVSARDERAATLAGKKRLSGIPGVSGAYLQGGGVVVEELPRRPGARGQLHRVCEIQFQTQVIQNIESQSPVLQHPQTRVLDYLPGRILRAKKIRVSGR